ncbi:MAG: hypothetical protein ACD_15C00114G0011 [uncultured bacterium]|nr:MAG: hypothetical protein ACD_15C00114G0011 [uncultured bacterium]
MKKKIKIFVISVLAVVFCWLWLSFIVFGNLFSPLYVIDLYDQNKYYQNHIGNKLLQYGQEYKIDDNNTSDWKKYQDDENKFYFKYPNKFNLKNIKITDKYYILIFLDEEEKNYCEFDVDFGDQKVGKKWLPEIRRQFEHDLKMSNRDYLWYLYFKNGKVFKVIDLDIKKNNNIQLTSVLFVSEENIDKFIKISSYNNRCPKYIFNGVLATLEFVY